MEPLPSPEPGLSRHDTEALLDLVETTLRQALLGDGPRPPSVEDLPEALRRPGGIFVSLHVDGDLNGCIGTIRSDQPIGRTATRMALQAAFADPRLPALRPDDLADLEIEVSLMSGMSPIGATSITDLAARLRPDVDGAVVAVGSRQGLFLPSVWEQLPDPVDFVDHLWLKAGLVPRSWPRGIDTHRFTAARHSRKLGMRGSSAAS